MYLYTYLAIVAKQIMLEIDAIHVSIVFIIFIILESLWEVYLHYRQIQACNKDQRAFDHLKEWIKFELFEKERIYEREIAKREILSSSITMVLNSLELILGLYPVIWEKAEYITSLWKGSVSDTHCAFAMILAVYWIIRMIPVWVYGLWIEVYYQPVKQKFWKNVLNAVADGIFFVLIWTLIAHFIPDELKPYFVIGMVCGYFLCVLIIFTSITLIWIPCGGKRLIKEFPDGPVITELSKLCQATNFPITNIYIVKSYDDFNAYFIGSICIRRVVILSSLLSDSDESAIRFDEREIAAIVAHELGHWWYFHPLKMVILSALVLTVTAALVELLVPIPQIYEAARFEVNVTPLIVGYMLVFRFALIPYLNLLCFVIAAIMNYTERQADFYALKLGYGKMLMTAIVKLYAANHYYPIEDSLSGYWYQTHPTLVNRLRLLQTQESMI